MYQAVLHKKVWYRLVELNGNLSDETYLAIKIGDTLLRTPDSQYNRQNIINIFNNITENKCKATMELYENCY